MKKLPRWHEKRGSNLKGGQWVAYYHVVRTGGKVKWTPLGTDKSAALRKWAEIEAKPVPAEAGSFNAVANQYMTWARLAVEDKSMAERTLRDREKYLQTMRPVFGDKPFEAIESQHVRLYIDKRSSKISGKKEMRFLSVLWNWARERGITRLSNPVAGVKMPHESGRSIEVRAQDYWLVWECADQLVKDVLELAARLGTRPQEVFGLAWNRIDLSASPMTIRVWQNKVKGWRTVIADPDLEALVGRLRRDRDRPKGHVLTDENGDALNPMGAFRYRFLAARKAALARAQIEGLDHQDFQLRDLRPMAGLAMLDTEGMDAARRLLGHTTERMTAHYTTKRRGSVSKSAAIGVRTSSNSSQE